MNELGLSLLLGEGDDGLDFFVTDERTLDTDGLGRLRRLEQAVALAGEDEEFGIAGVRDEIEAAVVIDVEELRPSNLLPGRRRRGRGGLGEAPGPVAAEEVDREWFAAAERDAAIEKLNARTREFNELVEKYNKLAKER